MSNPADNTDIEQAVVSVELDATGLFCPEPVMLVHNRIRDMREGDLLRIAATDPSTSRDIPKFCLYLGHELVAQDVKDGKYLYLIRKCKT